jgi:hypothetical protein
MSTSRARKTRFLTENPYCAFCGGGTKATTIEHCPPRAMFQYSQWPMGFAYPACEDCNHGSSRFDHVFAVIARNDPSDESGNEDGRLFLQLAAINEAFPGLAGEVIVTACEARQLNRQLGKLPSAGMLQQDTGIANFPPLFVEAVEQVASKLAKGLYLRFFGEIFPKAGAIAVTFETNVNLVKFGYYNIIAMLDGLGGLVLPSMSNNGRSLETQFQCKVTKFCDCGHFLVQARFGRSFCIAAICNPKASELKAMLDELRKSGGAMGPFRVLQEGAIP